MWQASKRSLNLQILRRKSVGAAGVYGFAESTFDDASQAEKTLSVMFRAPCAVIAMRNWPKSSSNAFRQFQFYELMFRTWIISLIKSLSKSDMDISVIGNSCGFVQIGRIKYSSSVWQCVAPPNYIRRKLATNTFHCRNALFWWFFLFSLLFMRSLRFLNPKKYSILSHWRDLNAKIHHPRESHSRELF